MMRNRVAFVANSLENAYKFQRVLADIGVDVSAGSTVKLENLAGFGSVFDLVIFEAVGPASARLGEVRSAAEAQGFPLLVIADKAGVANLGLPDRVPSDFVVSGASHAECKARISRLLRKSCSSAPDDRIIVDDMVINLSTYQVTVAGDPVDLTYLEYALLAFFASHPGRAFTRDALLQDVWGFDYFGGSRTVDVHVRRIRAKIGPGLAQHLETVRGVGYLWNPRI